MDIMPTGRGMGRGRGRGRQLSVPNGRPLSPIDPPSGQSSVANGVASTRGRGRGHGLRSRAVIPMAPVEIRQPDPASSPDQEGAARISEKDKETIRTLLQSSVIPIKKPTSLCKMWTYPRGITNPILVLSMNEFLRTEELFIPGEISMAPFTIKDGVDLKTTYWTLVDPSKDLPPEKPNAAINNTADSGSPQSKTCVNSRYHQNYKRIVQEIEAFIRRTSEPVDQPKEKDDNEEGEYVVFCQKDLIPGYTSGLDWLYTKAGKDKFPHKLVALESLLVVLSHGGLKQQAERKGFAYQPFPQILRSFSLAVASITRGYLHTFSTDPQAAIEKMNAEVQYILSQLTDCFVSRTRFTQYITIGEKAARLAGRRVVEYPQAFLGAFLTEGQVSRYLHQMDYTNNDQLVCSYHQASEQKWMCARFNVVRMIYTALDVLLANYEIEPIEGQHFPQVSYYAPI